MPFVFFLSSHQLPVRGLEELFGGQDAGPDGGVIDVMWLTMTFEKPRTEILNPKV